MEGGDVCILLAQSLYLFPGIHPHVRSKRDALYAREDAMGSCFASMAEDTMNSIHDGLYTNM